MPPLNAEKPEQNPMATGDAALDDHHASPDERDESLKRQKALGLRLRSIFDDVVHEPVPNTFLDLLEKLDHKEEKR